MKRRFFQIHLLTAVVGMIVFGGFMGLNLTNYKDDFRIHRSSDGYVWQIDVSKYHRGWPWRYVSIEVYDGPYVGDFQLSPWLVEILIRDRAEFEVEFARTQLPTYSPECVNYLWHKSIMKNGWPYERAGLNWNAVFANAAIGVIVTLLLMIGAEWFMRRGEAGGDDSYVFPSLRSGGSGRGA